MSYFLFKPCRVLIFGLCMCFAGVLQAADKDIAVLANSYPMPCMDTIGGITADMLYKKAIHTFVKGMKKDTVFASQWLPGNPYYDQAFELVNEARKADESLNGRWIDYSAPKFLESAFANLKPEELQFLLTFIPTPEGKDFWNAFFDGAICAGLLSSLQNDHDDLTPEQLAVLSKWSEKMDSFQVDIENSYHALPDTQKKVYERAVAMVSSAFESKRSSQQDAMEMFGISTEKMQSGLIQSFGAVYDKFEAVFNAFVEAEQKKSGGASDSQSTGLRIAE